MVNTKDGENLGAQPAPDDRSAEAVLARYKEHIKRVLPQLLEEKRKSEPAYNWDKLAQQLGIANSAMSLIKNGKMALNVAFLPLLANEFKCDQTVFLPQEDQPKRSKGTSGQSQRYLESDVTRAITVVSRRWPSAKTQEVAEIAFEALRMLPEYPTDQEIETTVEQNLLRARRSKST
jgi:transcriptional regulator with XRE-family HTH domain